MYKHQMSFNLITSEKWRQFLESTAAALQINLVFLASGEDEQYSACNKCAACGNALPPWDTSSGTAMTGESAVKQIEAQKQQVFSLDARYFVAARNYPCSHNGNTAEFLEKVNIARELLIDFYKFFMDRMDNNQLAAKLTTLHRINHMILSLIRDDHRALERVLGLVLSAAIILFNAEGSWLEYRVEAQQYILTKGNCAYSSESASQSNNQALSAEINSPVINGTFGIILPAALSQVNGFLNDVIDECIWIFEIDKLLKMMDSEMPVILNAVDNMVLLIDRRKTICFANAAALRMLNRSLQDLIARAVCEIDAPWKACISSETKNITKGIKDHLKCGIDERYIDWEVHPLAEGTDIPGWFIVARDCTDYYSLQELSEKTENFVHASTLLHVLAHEIRNPLATFKGLFQIIDIRSATSEISKYVSIGLNEIKKLSFLLDELSQLGKTVTLSLEETDLKVFMEEALILANASFSSPDIKILSTLNTVKPVLADKRQLMQVVFNLVKNAYEALGNNHEGRITLCLNQNNWDWIEIKVCDNGPGISDSIRDKLFKPYFSTKTNGTGLGLTITNTIVSKHKGKISCCNLPDGGACFSILLPVYETGTTQKPERTSVLLVTNDSVMRHQSERVFKTENIDFYSLNRCESVLALIVNKNPQIIFIDDHYLNVNILNKLIQNIMSNYPDINILAAGDRLRKANSDVIFIGKPLNDAKLAGTIKSLLK